MNKRMMYWSGGKDSAYCLYEYLKSGGEVDLLLTTVSAQHQRISMHGVRRDLLEEQVEALGMKLEVSELAEGITMEDYEELNNNLLSSYFSSGYREVLFGDIFLEDLKKFREKMLSKAGLRGVYPLWKKDTSRLIRQFVNSGFKAIVVAANAKLLGEEFVGREIDQSFIDDLPENVDPCGENGEFHSFVYDGPIFKKAVCVEIGEKHLKSYEKDEDDVSWDRDFWFCELLPKSSQ